MSYTEQVTVLELLIHIIGEHEKRLDELIGRLEAVTISPEDIYIP